jgi:uroporphyrinogen-III synthase
VLFVGAEDARRLLVEQLGADFVPLYRTRLLTPREPLDVDLVVLASPSAANALAGARNDLPVVSIGPETTAASRDLGMRVVREAQTQDHGGLLDAVIAATR